MRPRQRRWHGNTALRLLVALLPLILCGCASDEYFDFSGDGLRVKRYKGKTCTSPRTTIYLLESPGSSYMHLSTGHIIGGIDGTLFVGVTADAPIRFTSPVYAVTSLDDNKTYEGELDNFGSGVGILKPTQALTHKYPKGQTQYWTDLGLAAVPRLQRFTLQFPPIEVGGRLVEIPKLKVDRKRETYWTGLCLR